MSSMDITRLHALARSLHTASFATVYQICNYYRDR